jgi:hypothetical protein
MRDTHRSLGERLPSLFSSSPSELRSESLPLLLAPLLGLLLYRQSGESLSLLLGPLLRLLLGEMRPESLSSLLSE